jgi:hypothetical protein
MGFFGMVRLRLLGEADEVGREVGSAILLGEASGDCLQSDGFLHGVREAKGDEGGGVFGLGGRSSVAHRTDILSNDFQ